MRKDIKNKVQLTAMVHPDFKVMVQNCAKFLGVPPNEAVEVAIARLHADKSKPTLSAKTSTQEINTQLYEIRQAIQRLSVIVECLRD